MNLLFGTADSTLLIPGFHLLFVLLNKMHEWSKFNKFKIVL